MSELRKGSRRLTRRGLVLRNLQRWSSLLPLGATLICGTAIPKQVKTNMTDNEKFVVKRMNAEQGLAAPRFHCAAPGCLNQPSQHGASLCRDHERVAKADALSRVRWDADKGEMVVLDE